MARSGSPTRHSVILGYYEGEKNEPELPASVYRVDGQTGTVTVVADDVQGPNGLAFSPDESKLYVVESRGAPIAKTPRVRRQRRQQTRQQQDVHRRRPRYAGRLPRRYRRQSVVRLGHGRAELDGVRVFNPAGEPIGHIALPERCANLCFGGR